MYKVDILALFNSWDFLLFSVLLILVYTLKSVYRKRKLNFIDRLIGIAGLIISIVGILGQFQIFTGMYVISIIGAAIFLLIMFSPYLLGEKVKKKFGNTCKIKCGVQYYLERNDILFEEFIRQAHKEIVFVSISHEYMQSYEKRIVSEAIRNRNIAVTVLVLEPTSNKVNIKERVFGIGNFGKGDLSRGLKERVENSLKSLRLMKNDLKENKEKLKIETYDDDINSSLIIIDHYYENGKLSDNACIKIEEHYLADSYQSRKNVIVFRKDNQDYYDRCYSIYENIDKRKLYC